MTNQNIHVKLGRDVVIDKQWDPPYQDKNKQNNSGGDRHKHHCSVLEPGLSFDVVVWQSVVRKETDGINDLLDHANGFAFLLFSVFNSFDYSLRFDDISINMF